MGFFHRVKLLIKSQNLRIMVLFATLIVIATAIVMADTIKNDATSYYASISSYGSAITGSAEVSPRTTPFPSNIVTSGNLGHGGAFWRLYDDGIVVVESGHIREFAPRWNGHYRYIRRVTFTSPVIAMHLQGMFSDVPVSSIEGAYNIDTSNVTDMTGVFASASSLQYIDISSWDTSNVVSMAAMFDHAFQTQWEPLSSLDLSAWDTSRVEDMISVFRNTRLGNLNISSWDTGNVTRMSYMFEYSLRLSILDLSNWNTSNVTHMDRMFASTRSLTSLDLSGWDTRNVINMNSMFNNTALRQLTLGEYFVFHTNAMLPPVPRNNTFTGYWQNVGTGTINNPKGNFIFTSEGLMRYYDGAIMADTWVWQPTGQEGAYGQRIYGYFTLPNPARDVTIELRRSTGAMISTTTITPTGTSAAIPFIFDNIFPGSYTLIFRQPGHTSFTINNIVIDSQDIDLAKDPHFPERLPLYPGDINGDGQVNISDLTVLLAYWMSDNEYANLTGDGQVNVSDLSLLVQNWMAESVVVD